MKVHLLKGARYRATISLGVFESLASNETIKGKLEDAGFIGVIVSGSGKQRFAMGTWAGGDTTAELPSQVSEVSMAP